MLDVKQSYKIHVLILSYLLLTIDDRNTWVIMSLINKAITEVVNLPVHGVSTNISFLVTIKADELLGHYSSFFLYICSFPEVLDIETPIEKLSNSPEAVVVIEEHLGSVILVVEDVVEGVRLFAKGLKLVLLFSFLSLFFFLGLSELFD